MGTVVFYFCNKSKDRICHFYDDDFAFSDFECPIL